MLDDKGEFVEHGRLLIAVCYVLEGRTMHPVAGTTYSQLKGVPSVSKNP
jgi:hypothetical protein